MLAAAVNRGSAGNNGSVTIAVSPNADINVGDFIVVLLSERDWGITSLADNSGQAGAANVYTQDKSRLAADPFVYVYSCQVTRKILSTDTITATFAGGSGRKSMCVLLLPDANEAAQLDQTQSAGGGGAPGYTSGAVAATAQADEYAVGIAAFSVATVAPGVITADSPWVLEASHGVTGYGDAHGSRVLDAIGTPAFTGGWGVTHDGLQSGAIATYKGTAAAGGPTYNSSPTGRIEICGNATSLYTSPSITRPHRGPRRPRRIALRR